MGETKTRRRPGLAGAIEIVLILVVLAAGGFVAWRVLGKEKAPATGSQTTTEEGKPIKHLGFELGEYDAKTKTAGELKFTKIPLEFDRLVYEYGFSIPANSAAPARSNPQPTFVLPLGTEVRAIVDGTVSDVPTLYSNDYSVMVEADGTDDLIFEMEHIKDVKVKKGDRVTAGQVIGVVSDYDTRNTPGFGLFEIGVLKGGNPPQHLCPADYMSSDLLADIGPKLTTFYEAWNGYRGKAVYDVDAFEKVLCLNSTPVEG